MTSERTRRPDSQKPQAFGLEEVEIEPVSAVEPAIAVTASDTSAKAPVLAPRPRPRRGWPWGRWLLGLVGSLVVFGLGLAVTDWVLDLFSRRDWLGWTAMILAGSAGVAALGLVGREVLGLFRLARLSRLRHDASDPMPNEVRAAAVTEALLRIYRDRPELANAAADLKSHSGDVLTPAERIALAEKIMMPALDAEARRMIGDAVARVSVVTAVSPAALIDIGVVLVVHLALVRRLAELYGGRPGGLALIGLSRRVLAHLALTGGIALGDDMIQQILGHGLAARLSARLGEGVLNGLLTARVGRAALEVCRPVPFAALPAPKISQLAASVLVRKGDKPADERSDT